MTDGWTWLLLALPLAFGLGWLSSRIDLRQVRREARDSPRAYYKGLNLLLNEQQDKAIDAFIEAVQNDPDTTELHFALGSLFRRRGEFERSVRVHQHLLARADLAAADRDRAQYALAQDYAKAGLFDRAEQAYRALEDSLFATEARRALLDLYERSREWSNAREMATKLEAAGAGSYATRISHHLCEEALECLARPETPPEAARDLLQQALTIAPGAARPLVLMGQWWARQGQARQALATWSTLLRLPQAPVALVAGDIVQLAQASCPSVPGQGSGQAVALAPDDGVGTLAADLLRSAYAATGSLSVLQALNRLEPAGAATALRHHLQAHPSLSAAAAVMKLPPADVDTDSLLRVQQSLEHSSQPLRRYRCAACGFEAQRYFWQCPGCLSWDSYPPQQIEEY